MIAFVLGGGKAVWEDLEAARQLGQADMIVACNHAGRDAPFHVDHWASMHPDLFPKWVAERRAAGRPDAGKLWGARHRQHRAAIACEPIESWGGSSGLLCVTVALQLGCTHIILCGVPMHQNAAHYDRVDKKWIEARQYWGSWERWLPQMHGKVKSFSGQTFHWLGSPTREWLNAEQG